MGNVAPRKHPAPSPLPSPLLAAPQPHPSPPSRLSPSPSPDLHVFEPTVLLADLTAACQRRPKITAGSRYLGKPREKSTQSLQRAFLQPQTSPAQHRPKPPSLHPPQTAPAGRKMGGSAWENGQRQSHFGQQSWKRPQTSAHVQGGRSRALSRFTSFLKSIIFPILQSQPGLSSGPWLQPGRAVPAWRLECSCSQLLYAILSISLILYFLRR